MQTYVPTYRVPFFEQLRSSLAEDGVELRIASSRPRDEQAARGDEVELDWVDRVVGRQIKVGDRRLLLTSSARYWSGSDAVICMQQGSSLDTNHALAVMNRRKIRVGLWGHIRPYTSRGNPLDLWLERKQLRRADHIFAYTAGGARYAEAVGVSADAITDVGNTVDTSELSGARRALNASDIETFRNRYSLNPGRTFAFIGGLDESKRIGLLAESLDRVWAADPLARLLVGGIGGQAHLLDRSVARGQTIMLGRVASREKALMGACSRAVAMPGRIGLVALDALVLGTPILTTDWAFHAPEADYLKEGESKFVSRDSADAFADLMLCAIEGDVGSRGAPAQPWEYPTMNAMVENFTRGVWALVQGH